MPEHQSQLSFDAAPASSPAVTEVSPGLRDEIATAWGLPLGGRVEVYFRQGPLDRIAGILELTASPAYPWDPREPLALRIAGYNFSSRDIEHWAKA